MTWLADIKVEYDRLSTKALSHRPDLAGRVHLLSSSASSVGAYELQDYTDYARAHAVHVWVRRGVKVVQDNFSPLPVVVVDGENEPLDDHPVTQLFSYISDQHGSADFWASWIAHMYLGGEAFSEIVGDSRKRPSELWMRRPDLMALLPDASRLQYPAVAGYRFNDEVDYEPDEMIHWKFDNPLNAWRGLSLIGAARAGIVIDAFAQAWSKSLLRDGGFPDLAIIAPQGITASEREVMETTYMEKFMGWGNWRKPIVLEQGITDIKPVSYPPRDMEWLDQRKLAREEIGAILGVPDVLMGWGPETYDTEEKRTAALRTLWTLTLIPLVQLRDSQLNTFFHKRRPMLAEGETIQTDLSGVGVLQEDIAPKVETARFLWSMGVPFNRIDERLGLGIGEVPGGDQAYLPVNLMPAGSLSNAPTTTLEATARPVAKDLVHAAPAFDSLEHRALMRRADASTLPHTRQMVRLLKRYFQEQQNSVGQRLRELAGQKQEQLSLPIAELFDQAAEAARFRATFKPLVNDAFAEFGAAALELVLGAEAGAFEMGLPQVQQSIQYILEQHSLKTNNTTFTQLTGLFQQAAQDGASVTDMMDRLGEYFSGRKSDYECERIARTTMIASNNAASLMAYSQSGVVYGHEWLAALDERTRPTHAEAHGQFVPLGGRFQVGSASLQYPGDPSGPAGEVVNCRCTTLPVTRLR